jgi:excisionase family DNA binding protein
MQFIPYFFLRLVFAVSHTHWYAANSNGGPRRERNMETPVEEAWLSYPEAQRFSGLGRTKLWELISAQEVKAAKVGRAVRISRRSLYEYMDRSSYAESSKQANEPPRQRPASTWRKVHMSAP